MLALLRGRSAAAPGRDPSLKFTLRPEDVFLIPPVPAPGSGSEPRVAVCRLPGGNLCTCAVPQLSALEVRRDLAVALHVSAAQLADYALLLCEVHRAGAMEIWNESHPLPPEFFEPTPVPTRWGCRHRRTRWPSLQLCRLQPAPSLSEPSGATRVLLDCEAALDSLHCGDFPLSLPDLPDVTALALLLTTGAPDRSVHSSRLLRRALPCLLPTALLPPRRQLEARHESLLQWHAEAATRAPSVHAARLRLLGALRAALPRLDVGAGSLIDMADCHIVAGVRITGARGSCRCRVASSARGLVLLRGTPRGDGTRASNVGAFGDDGTRPSDGGAFGPTAVAATAAAASAEANRQAAEVAHTQQPQREPNKLTSARQRQMQFMPHK